MPTVQHCSPTCFNSFPLTRSQTVTTAATLLCTALALTVLALHGAGHIGSTAQPLTAKANYLTDGLIGGGFLGAIASIVTYNIHKRRTTDQSNATATTTSASAPTRVRSSADLREDLN